MTMTQAEQQHLVAVREAVAEYDVRFHLVRTFTHGTAVQVEARPENCRWRKVGPLLFPPDDGTLADVLTMLAEMRVGAA